MEQIALVRWSLLLAGVLSVGLASAAEPVPVENRAKGALPSPRTAEVGAALLVSAMAAGDPAIAGDFFFPEGPFLSLKESWDPGRYHSKLRRWFAEDLAAEGRRLGAGAWALASFELGRCRWIEAGREGNKIPYWSCRGSTLQVTDGTRSRIFEIHTLINWGERWYVTHLGPVRK